MNRSARDVWFFSRDGQQSGPLTYADLKEKADQGLLRPRHDLVWKEGMPDWRPIGEIDGLFERQPLHAPTPAVDALPSLAQGPQITHEEETAWPGSRRRGFFAATIILPAIWIVLASLAPMLAGKSVAPAVLDNILLGGYLITSAIIIYVVIQRFANLGMSRLWFLGLLVPILNLWLNYRIFSCPAGYAVHKKMDGVGIFLAIIYWTVIVLEIVAIIGAIAIFTGAAGNPELQEQLKKTLAPVLEQLQHTPPIPAK